MLSKRSLAGLASLGSVCAVVLCGCGEATFIKTSRSFKPQPRNGYPEVCLDRQPNRSYDPVGIIQIAGHLSDVIDEVKEKGKELGCDVVVDRRIHRVSERSVPESPRWVVRAAPLRRHQPDRLFVSRASAGRASRELSSLFGYPYQPVYTPAPTVVSAPLPEQEFICGIFSYQRTAPAAPTKATVPPGMALWNFTVEEREGGAACRAVAEALKEESECAGPQCVGALTLSRTFFSRCAEDEPRAPGSVTQLLKRWEKESGGEESSYCAATLGRATRSRSEAKLYQDRCIRDRARSNIETRILLRAAEGNKN